MTSLRALVTGNRSAALLLVAASLLLRMIVPAGYMVGSHNGLPTIELCNGMVAAPAHDMSMMMAHDMPMSEMAMSGMHHSGSHQEAPTEKSMGGEMPCAFAAFSLASILGADLPLLIVTAQIFATTLLFGPLADDLVLITPRHLRPLVRGPPAY